LDRCSFKPFGAQLRALKVPATRMARAIGAALSIFDQSSGDCPMNVQTPALKPAAELARLDPVRFPNADRYPKLDYV
jgi:hypothetical protein